MSPRRCLFVDVFTSRPLLGNPVAVVLDGDGVPTDVMQSFARFTNLSETTFVERSDRGDYRLRIFIPTQELPFAGHPTIGSAHAVVTAGVALPADGRLVQDCAAGPVPIDIAADGMISAVAPRAEPLDTEIPVAELADALGGVDIVGEPRVVDSGPLWLTARLVDGAAVRAVAPDMAALTRLYGAAGATGVNVYGPDGEGFEVRSFAPADGIPEDPVCGSGNIAAAAHLRATGHAAVVAAGYVARQGRCIGRDGYVTVRSDADGNICFGGHAVTVIEGTVDLG